MAAYSVSRTNNISWKIQTEIIIINRHQSLRNALQSGCNQLSIVSGCLPHVSNNAPCYALSTEFESDRKKTKISFQ